MTRKRHESAANPFAQPPAVPRRAFDEAMNPDLLGVLAALLRSLAGFPEARAAVGKVFAKYAEGRDRSQADHAPGIYLRASTVCDN